MRPLLSLLACLFLLGHSSGAEPQKLVPLPRNAQQYNRLLGRGINLGNALEAPKEGGWGVTLEASYFEAIEKAGFSSVRIPVRWSAHTGDKPPYEIDAAFLTRVDWAVDQALSRDLAVVLNVHHFDEILRDPDKQEAKLLALWKQIAEHYRDRNGLLSFELLNEPNNKLTDERWDKMIPALLDVVRASNPKRDVIVGPGHWNNLNNLDKLNLPEKDRRLIVTFHYYSPFEFTHQGAEWVKDSNKWKGDTWTGTAKEIEALDKDFAKAAAWAKKNDRPLFLGEFGAYSAADMELRAKWTRAITRAAEKQGFSWAYWEFCSGFGAYDKDKRAWHKPLLAALMDRDP
jgi:endoglucanase